MEYVCLYIYTYIYIYGTLNFSYVMMLHKLLRLITRKLAETDDSGLRRAQHWIIMHFLCRQKFAMNWFSIRSILHYVYICLMKQKSSHH